MARRISSSFSVRSVLARAIRGFLSRAEMLPIVLRPYQIEAIEATARWLEDPKGSRAAFVNQATGLGKTILEATLACVARDEINALYIVPNKLLVAQTARQIAKLTGTPVGQVSSMGVIKDADGEDVVAVKGHRNHSIVITTEASFKRRAEQLARELKPQLIIRDECHWSYTEKGQDALEHFPNAIVIGFSATPDFLTTCAKPSFVPVTLDNGQVMYAPEERLAKTYYPHLIDRRTVRWGIEEGYLAPLAWAYVEFDLDLGDVPVTDTPLGMDYDPEELRKVMAQNWSLMEDTIVRLYADRVYNLSERKVCAMCPGVAEAKSLAAKLSRFVKTAVITGETLDEDRDTILASYESDDTNAIRFLSSVFVLREGWDSRVAEVALMLRPTKSRVLYEQFLGRILRPRKDGGDKVALALDAHFLGTKLHPLNAPTLYGIPGEEVVPGEIFMGPKRSHGPKMASLYRLPEHIRPSLHIVQAVQTEYWADENGFFQADGEKWGTVLVWAKWMGSYHKAVHDLLKDQPFKKGRNAAGCLCDFYSESVVRGACGEILKKSAMKAVVSTAGDTGAFLVEGVEYRTVNRWASDYGLVDKSVKTALAACVSRPGIIAGQLRDFYSRADFEKACTHLLKIVPNKGSDYSFRVGGRCWGTINYISDKINCNRSVVVTRLGAQKGIPSLSLRNSRNQSLTIYPLALIKALCAGAHRRRLKELALRIFSLRRSRARKRRAKRVFRLP